MNDRCLNCRFFNNDPARVEDTFPGLTVLSSAYSSVRADAGICSRHDLFLSPWKTCRDFEPRESWKDQIESLLAREDREALLQLVRSQPGRLLRYLAGRLGSAEDEGKWRAVRALGMLVGDAQLVSRPRAVELLRRFFWALNDESGTVPYGVPEAVGEILATRPELQEDFLPILCALVTEPEMQQTGPIERGVLWALGRVGPPVARYSPEAVEALRVASTTHPDGETRTVAARSLASVLA